jgi:ABC-type lipoprotein export system ATPase subunit
MAELLVAAEGLARTYRGGVTALREARFVIEAGDRIALVGPSGSGKSTLLHLIAGIDRPTAGELDWPGLAKPLRPGRIGIAFQGLSLLPQLNVAENIALPLALAGAPDDDEVHQLIVQFGLSDVEDKLPEEISGGQAQRAAVARAVVGRPRLVLADEPTGQQDQASAQALLDSLFERVDALAAALVVATHDEAVAARFPIRWTLQDQRLRPEEALRSR